MLNMYCKKSDCREEMGELKYIGSFLIFLFFTFKNKAEMVEVPKVEHTCGTANVDHDVELGSGTM